MKSKLYTGLLRHRRHEPTMHNVTYRVFMPFLCLQELPELLDKIPLWSARHFALGYFRRSDFLGDNKNSLIEEVRHRIFMETKALHEGPIFLLANLRYFGFQMNPIAFYYCYNREMSELQYIVAEVNNTPWDERHSYVLEGPGTDTWLKTEFDKSLHVSPFNPMDMQYHWRSNTPGSRLIVHLKNYQDDRLIFDASLALKARALNAWSLNLHLIRYPLMTINIGAAIYWEALKLFVKGTPLYSHPKRNSPRH